MGLDDNLLMGRDRYKGVSPILIIGIIIFIVPFFNGIGGLHFGKWVSWVGGIAMGIGVIHSATMGRE